MSHVVVLKIMPDGSLRRARPAYLFQDRRSATQKLLLPDGYVVAGSPEHKAAIEELERLERGA